MSQVTQAWVADNVSSPSTAHNFGPFTTAAAIVRILRVKADVGFGFAGISLAPTATLADAIVWGVQYGPVGYTPLVLPAQIGGSNFFWSELVGFDGAGGAAWSPPTSNVGWMGFSGGTRQWRGQQPVGIAADFYLTVGASVAGLPAFITTLSLEATYSY